MLLSVTNVYLLDFNSCDDESCLFVRIRCYRFAAPKLLVNETRCFTSRTLICVLEDVFKDTYLPLLF